MTVDGYIAEFLHWLGEELWVFSFFSMCFATTCGACSRNAVKYQHFYVLLCNIKDATPHIYYTTTHLSLQFRCKEDCMHGRRDAQFEGQLRIWWIPTIWPVVLVLCTKVACILTIAWLQISMDNILAVKIDHSCNEQNWSVTLVTLQSYSGYKSTPPLETTFYMCSG